MAEESSARSAWSLIMGTTENSSEGAQLRLLILLILIIGIGLAGYAIYEKTQYVAPVIIEATPQPPVADINRLQAMIRDINAANMARTQSMEIATAITAMARYPFVAEKVTKAAQVTLGEPQVIIIPPYIRVKATMNLEGRSVAVLDIEGEASGKIFKVGDRFAERKGRITRIAPEKVTIVYEGKQFVYTP